MATARQQVIKDEADAERRSRDAKGNAPEARSDVETIDKDAKRYRYLRDQVRNSDGSVNEKLYVRCDGRVDGRWALDGEELDTALDLLIITIPEDEVPSGRGAK
jgi:hypothetical protein